MSNAWQDPDLGKAPEQLFAERSKRLSDIASGVVPDRVPINVGFGYALAEWGGLTRRELQDNPDKCQELLEKYALDLQPDTCFGIMGDPRPSAILGDQMTKWPGYGLDDNSSFQFAEQEFMKAEDYDDFLFDPADWAIRKYVPRAFTNLGGFATLPPLGIFNFGYYAISNLGYFASPAMAEALQNIGKALQVMGEGQAAMIKGGQRMASLGFGQGMLGGVLMEAPFDFMSDTLRGMRGIFLDMKRHPDQLLEAEEKVLRLQVEYALHVCKMTGFKTAGIPLHRGSDGFMSIPQFEKFYWPQLKSMVMQLVDNGITPSLFYEGVWDQRLDYLAEFPKHKTIGMFQSSDIFKVKEKLGDVMMIQGGMPNSLLSGGTVESVRERTKEVCEKVGKGGGFMMCTGIMELEGTHYELVKAWVQATKEFGKY